MANLDLDSINKKVKKIKNNHELGDVGQSITLNEYLCKGYNLVCQNFQCYFKGRQGRRGEIDLIFEKNDKSNILIMCEVKTRSSQKFGSVFEQITKAKLTKLKLTAQYFLIHNPQYKNYFVRFDGAFVYNNQLTIIENI
jgi:putative endonuclease